MVQEVDGDGFEGGGSGSGNRSRDWCCQIDRMHAPLHQKRKKSFAFLGKDEVDGKQAPSLRTGRNSYHAATQLACFTGAFPFVRRCHVLYISDIEIQRGSKTKMGYIDDVVRMKKRDKFQKDLTHYTTDNVRS